MKQGIKGQDTVIQVIKGGQVVNSLTSVTSFTVKFDVDIISKGYVGETTERKDDIFKGVSGTIDFDWTDLSVLNFMDELVKRSRRAIAYFEVNILSTLKDADNNVKRIIVRDAHFSGLEANMSSRSDYMKTSLTWEASEYTIL